MINNTVDKEKLTIIGKLMIGAFFILTFILAMFFVMFVLFINTTAVYYTWIWLIKSYTTGITFGNIYGILLICYNFLCMHSIYQDSTIPLDKNEKPNSKIVLLAKCIVLPIYVLFIAYIMKALI